jgi:cytochrome-b5 reductase
MIAGGTGITPMYQVIRAICEDSTDRTIISLLYANNTGDILLREILDGWAKKYPKKFQVQYVGKASKGRKRKTGFVNKEMAETHLPAAAPDSKIF